MAGHISEATIEQVRSASDIVDVIGSYLPLKRNGANFVALCPFHREKTPSFNVHPNKQTFHCFGCHKGGNVISFVMEFENLPFPDAVRRLADRAKISIETDNTPGQKQYRHLKDQLLAIHEQITQRWQNALANDASGQPARDYLAKRGVSAEAIKLFRLGYAPDVWDDTVNWAKSKGYENPIMEQGGLILRKEGSDHFYDRFRGRLIFPICDEQGRVVGFSGRVLDADAKTAKYVNSPETPIFTKGKVFFGLDKSRKALLDSECAVVCEGQLDLIACYMGGVQNVVAPQGTALTADHARILKRHVEEVVLCFDSDDAGQNAAVRSLDSLLASGLAIRVAVVPTPHDPDSFIKEAGGVAFRDLIEQADGFFDYYLKRLCWQNDVSSDKGRLTILQDMAQAVHKTGNMVMIDTYAQKTALRLGVPPESVRSEFRKAGRMKGNAQVEQAEERRDSAAPPETTRPSNHEFWLLKLLLLSDDAEATLPEQFDPNWIQHSTVRGVVSQCLSGRRTGSWPGVAAYLTQCEAADTRSLITEAIAEQRTIENAAQQLSDLALRLRNQAIDRQLAALTQRAAVPELGETERLELLREQQVLRQRKREPLAPPAPEPAAAQPEPHNDAEEPQEALPEHVEAHSDSAEGDANEPF